MSRKGHDNRAIELIKKSHEALEAEYNDPEFEHSPVKEVGRRKGDYQEPPAIPSAASATPADGHGDDVIMYRGKPVRRSSGATPGAGSSRGRPTQFRGAGAGRPKGKGRSDGAKGSNTERIKQAIATLTEMHEEGLITKAEYDAKRRQLLDRL